jgi:hypothetical protein
LFPALTAPSNSKETAAVSVVATRITETAVPLGLSAAASSPSPTAGAATLTPNPASCPPNPNVAPHGLRIQAGALFMGCFGAGCATPYWSTAPLPIEGADACCRLYKPTRPSKEEVESTPGVVVDHCTSKFQFELAGSSARISPASVSQHSVRLSFPQVSKSPGSALDHAIARTPLLCPTNSLAGDMEFRKSQICSEHERSSSDATMSCVATSGFHCIALQRRREFGSVKEITGRWRFKSHTTVVPFKLEDAKMCCTLLFQAR